jgi:hypothetical protein
LTRDDLSVFSFFSSAFFDPFWLLNNIVPGGNRGKGKQPANNNNNKGNNNNNASNNLKNKNTNNLKNNNNNSNRGKNAARGGRGGILVFSFILIYVNFLLLSTFYSRFDA